MAQSRAGQVLAEEARPPGWQVSFRAPGGSWTTAAATPQRVAYREELPGGGAAELAVQRIGRDAGLDAGEICDQLTGPHRPFFTLLLASPQPKHRTELGPWAALELRQPEVPMIVRAAVLPSGEGYAVSLRVDGGVLDERLYRIFEAVCRSVQPLGRSHRVLEPAP